MPGRGGADQGARRVGTAVGLLLLLLFAVMEEQRLPGKPLPSPPLLESPSPRTPYLSELARRHRDERLTLDVIYASPMLPADEANSPVFRVVIAYQGSEPPGVAVLAGPAGLAQLRTSDGFMTDNLIWQEELRRDGCILGYLSSSGEDRNPIITTRTRWIELSLLGLTERPVRFRWPVEPRGRG
ncbi:MAG: hypothetical protein ACM3RP_05285 [Chitinophagales bacterium]